MLNLTAAIILFGWSYAQYRDAENSGAAEPQRKKVLRHAAMALGAILLGCAFPLSGILLGTNVVVIVVLALFLAVLARLRGTRHERMVVAGFLLLGIVGLGVLGWRYVLLERGTAAFRRGVIALTRGLEDGRETELRDRLKSFCETENMERYSEAAPAFEEAVTLPLRFVPENAAPGGVIRQSERPETEAGR